MHSFKKVYGLQKNYKQPEDKWQVGQEALVTYILKNKQIYLPFRDLLRSKKEIDPERKSSHTANVFTCNSEIKMAFFTEKEIHIFLKKISAH